MSEWKKVKLKEVSLTIQPGPFGTQLHNSDYTNYGIPVIMPRDMIDGRVLHERLEYVSEETANRISRHKVYAGDIIVARKGDVRKCIFIRESENGWITGSDCIKMQLNNTLCNSLYIYYQLRSPYIGAWLQKVSKGATMPSLNTSLLGDIEIGLPPLPTQHRIASILSRYDSLIENYQKQIKLLEEAAQRLYKEWFVDLHFPGHENTKIVDGVPEGWEKKPISQLGEYLNGFAFKPSDWQESGKPIIKIKEMGNGVSNDTPRNNGERVPAKYLVKAGDLLFSWSATLMVIVWSGEEGWLNQHLFKVTPAKGIGREFLLQSISNTIKEFLNLTTGSTMKHIQRNKLDQVFVNVPNDKIMKLYDHAAEKMRDEILHLSSQIRLLTEARDRMLPKLMNGEIEVC
jgi:type I restriction enzyme S subunit